MSRSPHARRPPDRLAEDRGERPRTNRALRAISQKRDRAARRDPAHRGAKASAEEAEPLEIEPGGPVLTMTRIAYDTGGRPIEYGWHRYPRRRLTGSG